MSETRIVSTPVGSFEVPAAVFAHFEALRTTNVDLNERVTRAEETAHRRLNSLDEATNELVRERDRRETAERRVREIAGELDTFRTQVRDLAIEKREEMGFCVPGLNAALRELGLDPMTREFDVTFRVWQDVTVTVDAVDEDDARRIAEDANDAEDIANRASRFDWEYDVEGVEETD